MTYSAMKIPPRSFLHEKTGCWSTNSRRQPLHNRELFFIYPRCNHVPYNHHSLEHWTRQTADDCENWLINNYDRGLRDFDQWTTDIVDIFKRRVSGDLFILITADHNELLGENGLRGHGTNDQPLGSVVPYLLHSNCARHAAIRTFSQSSFLDAFIASTFVMRLMGVTPCVKPSTDGVFYIGNALPYGRAGHMRVRERSDGVFDVEHIHRSGTKTSVSTFAIPR